MSQKVKSNRNITADYQRGLAAILVVTEHYISRDLQYFGDNNLFFYMMLYGLMQVYFFHAGVFAPSGIKKPAGEFFVQKALRLLVPYVMWSSVAVAAKTLLAILNGSFNLLDTVLLELETLIYAKSMWFLLSLFLMQTIFWLLYRLYKVKPIAAVIVAFVLITLPLPDMLTFLKTQEMLPAFAIGLYYAHNKEKVQSIMEKYRKVLWIPCVAFLACAPLYAKYAANNRMGSGLHFLLANVIALLTAFAFWYLLDLILRRAKTVKYVLSAGGGQYSLQIYCIHMVFVDYLPIRFPESVTNLGLLPLNLLYLLLGAVVSLICVGVSYFILDRIPLYRRLMLGNWSHKANVTERKR